MVQSNGLKSIFKRISEFSRHLVFPPLFYIENNTATNMFVLKFLFVQSFSHVTPMDYMPFLICSITTLSFTISQSLLKLKSIELVMPSNHFILCHSFLLPSNFPSIRVFSSESVLCISWPNYWSFNISPSKEYSGLISFRIDWFDYLAVQDNQRDSQENSPAPQFKIINSLALSFLYSPILTPIHEYWKHRSFDYRPLLAK